MPWVDINLIKEDPNNPRTLFSAQHIEGLAISLEKEGMINYLEVDTNYIIITGACRFRAAKMLNWGKVPVKIYTEELNEYTRLRRQIAENVHQSGEGIPMNPMDIARAYEKLLKLGHGVRLADTLEENHKSIRQLADDVGVPKSTIWEHLQLLNQPEFVQKALTEGLPRTYIREAENAPLEVQNDLKKKIVAGDYENREDIIQDVQLLKKIPDLTHVTLERQKAKANKATNRILNGIVRLALALEAQSLKEIESKEQELITEQLLWLMELVDGYLGGKNGNNLQA